MGIVNGVVWVEEGREDRSTRRLSALIVAFCGILIKIKVVHALESYDSIRNGNSYSKFNRKIRSYCCQSKITVEFPSNLAQGIAIHLIFFIRTIL